jgi:hypothetical protein
MDGEGAIVTTEHEFVDAESESDEDQKGGNAELRAALKRTQEALKEANQLHLVRNLTDIGLDPGTGLGKAIAKEYDGEMTVDAIAAYARDEYGHDAAVPSQVPQEVQAGDRLDQAMRVSTAVEPRRVPTPGEEYVEKIDSNDPEATRQDAIASIAAKAQQFQETFQQ